MVRTSHLTKLDIVRLYRNSYTTRDIRAALNSKGIKVTRQVIDYWVQQYRLGSLPTRLPVLLQQKVKTMKTLTRADVQFVKNIIVRTVHIQSNSSQKGFFLKGLRPHSEGHLPAVRQTKVSDQHRFQMDNDPKHRSKVSKDFMTANGINWWDVWPSESADLNPIEMVWSQLKRHLSTINMTSKEELVNNIRLFWSTYMTKLQCATYIDNVYKVVPVCILMKRTSNRQHPKQDI
ncbi:unnamed protein product [Mytilus coruscus]|uniref:Tc1-like transposase DDE domain-containing protein n=1 Tax=Mytilus coruscus TaxID=42192 RepID=A0A6J8ELQ0_MYTCO|nr:unnamed protein product [Mytilus coruscus]